MDAAFDSPERETFYSRSGLPYWNIQRGIGTKSIARPYALYTCRQESAELLDDIRTASVAIGELYVEMAQKFAELDDRQRLELGFHKDYLDLLRLPAGHTFCSRIGWAVTPDGLKMLEVNTEKPTFWIESERGNTLLSDEFGLRDATAGSEALVGQALDESICEALATLPEPPDEPHVGYIVRENLADLQNMRWLQAHSSFQGEALPIERLDFAKHNDQPYNKETGTPFDVLIFWYPFEYTNELLFENGDKCIDVLTSGLKQQSFAIAHGLAAYQLQPKIWMAYCCEHIAEFNAANQKTIARYIPHTVTDPSSLGPDYFAKPVWGREGRGCYRVQNNQPQYGVFQDDYFVKQPRIYQEFLELPKARIGSHDLTLAYESWIYRVNGGIVPGAIGIRASDNAITDDTSYFLPIGI